MLLIHIIRLTAMLAYVELLDALLTGLDNVVEPVAYQGSDVMGRDSTVR